MIVDASIYENSGSTENNIEKVLKTSKTILEVCKEDELSWEQHHEIHKALNIAYGYRTKAFTKRTYGHIEPIVRILAKLGDVLVGHAAIFEIEVIVNDEKIKAGGLGMTLSLKPFSHLGYLLREKATLVCCELGYPFAIGRVKNSERVKENLSALVSCFLDIPLIGKNTRSHDWETLAIYKTSHNQESVNSLFNVVKKNNCIRITGEIF